MTVDGVAIEKAKQKRERLHQAMWDLEAAVSAPAQVSAWIVDLSGSMTVFQDALLDHIVEVEGPEGIIARILEDVPRLSAHADVLLGDHPRLRLLTEQVTNQVQNAGPAPDGDAVRVIREAVLELLGQLSRHRHLGADLVYDAYNLDVGGQA